MEVFYILDSKNESKWVLPPSLQKGSKEDMEMNGYTREEICGDNLGHLIKYSEGNFFLYLKINSKTTAIAGEIQKNYNELFLNGICSIKKSGGGSELIRWIKIIGFLNGFEIIGLNSLDESYGFYLKQGFVRSSVSGSQVGQIMEFKIPKKISAKELLFAGYTASQIKEKGYTAIEMKKAGFSLKDLKNIGFTARELLNAGLKISRMNKLGFTAKDMRNSGFSLEVANNDDTFTFNDFIEAGYNPKEVAKLFTKDIDPNKITQQELKSLNLIGGESTKRKRRPRHATRYVPKARSHRGTRKA